MHHLIFDFDGVIGDTWEALVYAHQKMNPGMSAEEITNKTVEHFSRKPNHERHTTYTEEEWERKLHWQLTFGNFQNEIGFALFEDFLTQVRKIENKKTAVVSAGSEVYVVPGTTRASIDASHILAFENHHSKEEKMELVCRDWGVSPRDVYYFTDTLADVYELRDMLSEDKLIGCAWGFCGYDILATELKPEYILREATDLHRVLK